LENRRGVILILDKSLSCYWDLVENTLLDDIYVNWHRTFDTWFAVSYIVRSLLHMDCLCILRMSGDIDPNLVDMLIYTSFVVCFVLLRLYINKHL